jgi:hypothetical protein
MSTQYIINNNDSLLSGQTINGDLTVTGSINFTGNTSSNPITELHVCNIVGCSPITFFDSLQSDGSSANQAFSTALGLNVYANGPYSHAEGESSTANGYSSHAEGSGFAGLTAWDTSSTSNGLIQLPTYIGDITALFTVGTEVLLSNGGSISIKTVSGSTFVASKTRIQLTDISLSLGSGIPLALYSQVTTPGASYVNQTLLLGGDYSHAEGFYTTSFGLSSHAEGDSTLAFGDSSHSEGDRTKAFGLYSHAEGRSTIASGDASHAEGNVTKAIGTCSHAGGNSTIASGYTSFIHSSSSIVTGDRSVVLGGQNITGSTADTVYVPKLETDEIGEGVIMKSPDGTRYKLTIANGGTVSIVAV